MAADRRTAAVRSDFRAVEITDSRRISMEAECVPQTNDKIVLLWNAQSSLIQMRCCQAVARAEDRDRARARADPTGFR